MALEKDENTMPLEEFIKLPTTVDFGRYNTDSFKLFAKNNPYIKMGTELPSGVVLVYTNKENIPMLFEEFGSNYNELFPKILSPLDHIANTDAGITPIIEHPYLGLSGKGVIIGIVDTGIDYTKEVFRYEDGTTKIISIWDQSLDGERGADLHYGVEYSRDQINAALQSDNPLDMVPSKDTDGHGTFLASVAAGSRTDEYVGAAPGAELVIVKLKRANDYYIEKYQRLPDEKNLYESSDYLLGAKYIFDKSKELNVPIVLCVGMGSNQGSHDGNSVFEDYISFVSQRPGYAVVTAAGNESNAKHHTQGIIPRTGSKNVVGIRIGKEKASFSVQIIASPCDKISIGITSPTGEVIGRIPYKVGLESREELTFEKTVVQIGYYKDVSSVVYITFIDAKEGIWEITLYGDSIVNGEYNAWLPITGQVSPEVEFMKPVPNSTIVFPATSVRAITCGAYNNEDNSLYVSSSWGPTLFPRMSPDFVAPGVNVRGVYPSGFGTMTGTSVAAAVTAGAAAILMEWGIVQGNFSAMDGDMIRILLSTGCKREEGVKYPNTRWGYGRLDLIGTFSSIKESNIQFQSMVRQRSTDLLNLR